MLSTNEYYELGRQDGYEFNRPEYEKNLDYMRGYSDGYNQAVDERASMYAE